MLVLSRHLGERIFIGDNIVITVVEFRGGDKVRLGIECPKEIPVHREEVAIKIEIERQRFSTANDPHKCRTDNRSDHYEAD